MATAAAAAAVETPRRSERERSAEEMEAAWAKQENKSLPFIPQLHRVVGMTLDCYLSCFFVLLVAVARFAYDTVKAWLEQLMEDPALRLKRAQAKEKAGKEPEDPTKKALAGFMVFYTKYLYNTMADCFNRPIEGAAAKEITVVSREWKNDHGVDVLAVQPDHVTKRCTNLGSYNYLGFGGPNECTTGPVVETMRSSGVMVGTCACEMGVPAEQRELEHTVAAFVGKEDAIVMPMGFATNSLIIPALAGRGCLFLSDGLNHSSIVAGLRSSGATIRVVKHNDMKDLERHLAAAAKETPRWRRVLFACEGMYSMEGEVCPLPQIVRLCKRYGALLYVDEAHSIGALGARGRGVCDYHHVDPSDVDVLMGTFTKSFGSVGGYVAGSRRLIAYLRRHALGAYLGVPMSPAAAVQVTTALRELDRPAGQARIAQLYRNSVSIRRRLTDAGFVLLGPEDSPVVPIMIAHPQKMSTFSRECLRRGLAVVVVGYPATPLLGLRVRLCISAGFTDAEVEDAATNMIEVGRIVSIDYNSGRVRHGDDKKKPDDGADDDDDKDDKEGAKDKEREREQAPQYASEPLVADDAPAEREVRVINPSKLPKHVLSVHDYLGLANSARAVEESVRIVETYGVGSCGPRGFYGTTDRHLELERRLAGWLRTEAAIIYSYGALTITSVLGPYVTEETDVLVYDESVSMAAKLGIAMTKARKYPYPHNNMRALEAIMQTIQREERTRPRDWSKLVSFAPKHPRHLLFTEGVFLDSGDVAPLPEIVALKRRYGYMLCLDETHSLCTMGSTGLGVRQYFAEKTGDRALLEDPRTVDLLVGSLETAMGSIGGFCCGTRRMVQHQVLNAIGYVYSASTPPYLCEAACVAIDALENDAEVRCRVAALRTNTHRLRECCRDAATPFYRLFDVSGNNADSPLMFASLRPGVLPGADSVEDQLRVLEAVEDGCFRNDMGVCVARFAEADDSAPKRPSLRFAASAAHNPESYPLILATIARLAEEAIQQLQSKQQEQQCEVSQ